MSGTTTQTVGNLLTMALKLIGATPVGQSPSSPEMNDAMQLLNQMLAAWNAARWLVFALEDISITSTGAESYTIGLDQDFNVARPDRIEAAFMRQLESSNQYTVDFPLQIVNSREDYNRIALKGLSTFGRTVFYDAAYPVGNLYFWPIPNASIYELHVTLKVPLQQFTNLTQVVVLPPAYQEALLYNLAMRLCPLYGMKPDPTIVAIGKAAIAILQTSNAQVPTVQMPADTPGVQGTGVFNPYSGFIN